MNERISLESAAQIMREAMREAIKRYSIWYVVQGGLMMLTGAFAFVYPILPSSAVPLLLGWLLIISGAAQGVSLIGARNVPHFWVATAVGRTFRDHRDNVFAHPRRTPLCPDHASHCLLYTEGISKLILSLTIRPLPGWQWVLPADCSGLWRQFSPGASFRLRRSGSYVRCLASSFSAKVRRSASLAWQVRKA